MFNKQERARRVAAYDYHRRRRCAILKDITADTLEALNATARLHRKQAEFWRKHVKAFDAAALRTAKLVGRKP